nr:unnamed protein product [Digitaria exilis]
MSSSTSSRGSWSSTAGSRRSPIPYRKKPLDYEPAVLCHCGMKGNTTEGGCGFITWYEGPCNPFVASLLVDLRDAVWGLKDVNTALRLQLDDVTMRLEQEKNDAIALKELQRMEKEEEQLKLRDGRTNKAGGDRCLIIAVCVALCATWIWMALH